MSELEEWVDKPYKEARKLFDTYYLSVQVEKSKGDISAAALRAGIDRTMFYRKLRTTNENKEAQKDIAQEG
jgi:DNA-binding NtrC family response regulator